ncbi:MAG: molybdenum cofactor guanylyltransferase MobA, partial [Pseudomonadota bacterium]
FRLLKGRPLIAHVFERLQAQTKAIAINANADPTLFTEFAAPVIPDGKAEGLGPLAGVLAGLTWAAPRAAHVLTVPCDAPFLPDDLAARLAAALGAAGEEDAIAVAQSGGRLHPTCALWPVGLRDVLRRDLNERGARKCESWVRARSYVVANFDAEPVDPFLNVNTPADLRAAEALA